MKAITLIQPWATCIQLYGKRVENRMWAPAPSLIGQRIAIHAGGKIDPCAIRGLRDALIFINRYKIPVGCIVAVARLVGVVRSVEELPKDQHQWWRGPMGWVLADVVALEEPVPCRGAQGFWNVPPDVLERVGEQL